MEFDPDAAAELTDFYDVVLNFPIDDALIGAKIIAISDPHHDARVILYRGLREKLVAPCLFYAGPHRCEVKPGRNFVAEAVILGRIVLYRDFSVEISRLHQNRHSR
jgi:hypothetical protein